MKYVIFISVIFLVSCLNDSNTQKTSLSKAIPPGYDASLNEGFIRVLGQDMIILEKINNDTTIILEFTNNFEPLMKIVEIPYVKDINYFVERKNWSIICEGSNIYTILDHSSNSLFLIRNGIIENSTQIVFYP